MLQPDQPKTVPLEEAMQDPRAVKIFADAIGIQAVNGHLVRDGDTMKDVAEAKDPEDPASLSLAACIALYLAGYGGSEGENEGSELPTHTEAEPAPESEL